MSCLLLCMIHLLQYMNYLLLNMILEKIITFFSLIINCVNAFVTCIPLQRTCKQKWMGCDGPCSSGQHAHHVGPVVSDAVRLQHLHHSIGTYLVGHSPDPTNQSQQNMQNDAQQHLTADCQEMQVWELGTHSGSPIESRCQGHVSTPSLPASMRSSSNNRTTYHTTYNPPLCDWDVHFSAMMCWTRCSIEWV